MLWIYELSIAGPRLISYCYYSYCVLPCVLLPHPTPPSPSYSSLLTWPASSHISHAILSQPVSSYLLFLSLTWSSSPHQLCLSHSFTFSLLKMCACEYLHSVILHFWSCMLSALTVACGLDFPLVLTWQLFRHVSLLMNLDLH